MRIIVKKCEKVNLSLFENTLTIYPFITGDISEYPFSLYPELDLYLLDIEKKYTLLYLENDSKGHENLHKDEFESRNKHYHLFFTSGIDLKAVLEMLFDVDVITLEEKDSFLTAVEDFSINHLMEKTAQVEEDELGDDMRIIKKR